MTTIKDNLKTKLKEVNATSKNRIPKEILIEMEKATEDLKNFNFKEKTLQINDEFPDSILLTHKNQEISLNEMLGNKPTIINFYRGSWCPYCNIELSYYNELLTHEDNQYINMVSISPEKPDTTIAVRDIENLKFNILSDINNNLAKKLNLVFSLPEKIQDIYKKFGINLDENQGNQDQELPIPAVFIVDENGIVKFVDLDEDYTTRPDAEDIISKYKELFTKAL